MGNGLHRSSLQEASPREADAVHGVVVGEPAAAIAGGLIDEGTRQAVADLEDPLDYVPLSGAGGDEGDVDGVRQDGQGEGDAAGWGLGRVLNRGHPGVGLAQQWVAGKQAAGMAIGTGAEQQEVEDGKLHGIAAREGTHQELLVLVGELLRIVEVLGVDGVDDGPADPLGDAVQQLRLQQAVIAVLVV